MSRRQRNGFVWAAYRAYSNHHHLVLRPEDIWFSILTQLSFYINAHAEDLRGFFVVHEGQKELEAISDIKDFSALAMQMADLLEKNVNDPQLRDWVMPDFSTTTYHDKVVGAVLFMGAMQAYFAYRMTIMCGTPSVTLLGTVDDWKKILQRLDMIDQLGGEPRQFATMLRPILKRMILTFEEPDNAGVTLFWNTIVHHNAVGSGTDYLSGWLTAFCFWDDQGKPKRCKSSWSREPNALLDGVDYPFVDIDNVSLGYAAVPVHVNDRGDEYDATMLAGSVGIAALSSNASMAQPGHSEQQAVLAGDTRESIRDTVQPVSGWWICRDESKVKAKARESKIRDLKESLASGKPDFKAMGHHELEGYFDSEDCKRRVREYGELRDLGAF